MMPSFTTEKLVHAWLTRNVPADYTRIETNTALGVPDVNYCLNGQEGWIEYKVIENRVLQPDTMVRIRLRPEQVAWLTRRRGNGGRAFILIGSPTGELVVVDGVHARNIQGKVAWVALTETFGCALRDDVTGHPNVPQLLDLLQGATTIEMLREERFLR